MRQIIGLHNLLAASLLLALSAELRAEIIFSAGGIAAVTNEEEVIERVLNIANTGEAAVHFTARLASGNLGDRAVAAGPRRDARGGPDDREYEWRDSDENDGPVYQWIDIAEREGRTDIAGLADDRFYGLMDLGFEFPFYGHNYRQVGAHSNGFGCFVDAAAIVFFWPGWERLPNANPGPPDNTPPPTLLACNYQDLNPAVGGHIYYWSDESMAVITWQEVPHFADPQNQQPWTFQLILTPEGLVKFQYQTIGMFDAPHDMIVGLQNEERDRGFTVAFDDDQYLLAEKAVAFGPPGAWISWASTDPHGGAIESGSDLDMIVHFDTEGLEAGYYYARLIFDFEEEIPNVEIPLLLSFQSPVGALTGRVTDAATDRSVAGAVVSLTDISFVGITDNDGRFAMRDLPPRVYHLSAWAPNFNRLDHGEVEVEADRETEVALGLLHGEFTLDRDAVSERLAPETDIEVAITASNDGNADVTFATERRLLGEANVAPWEQRRVLNVGAALNDDRLEGVVFDGENFFLAGANADNPNTIYVLDREGNPVRSFNQPGESRYGMKDLDFDGQLLWGSGEQRVFGFDPDGNIATQFAGPFNPTSCVAYDSDRDVLWLSGTTTNIAGYTRAGEATGQVLNRRGLRIYGLAYWPDDPDGYPLYIYDVPAGSQQVVHKMNPATGDTLRAHDLPLIEGSAAAGAFITNRYDIYSWVLMTMNNIPRNAGGDRVEIWQLDARKEWMQIEPAEGAVAAGGRQEFTLTLDAAGLPVAEFEGEILFTHTGRGGGIHLPIRLDVAAGPVHGVRDLELAMGWNLVSVNLQPDERDVRVLTRGLVNDRILEIMKDDLGHFYRPAQNFNNIEGWAVAEGYWMKLTRAAQLRLEGLTVMADDPIQLHEGWQAVSYYPRQAVDAVVALSGIADQLVIAKDGFGRFYLPSRRFSNMGLMGEGNGYQLKLRAAAELVYRLAGRVAGVEEQPAIAPSHFLATEPTGRDMSVLLLTGLPGGEVAAFADGRLVGAGVIGNGLCGFAVRGDDPTTPELDGAAEEAPLTFRLWDGTAECLAETITVEGVPTYATDGLFVGRVEAGAAAPTEFALESVYPNPFNATAIVRFRLASSATLQIALFDQTGRMVKEISSGVRTAGRQAVAIDGSGLPSGIYFVRMGTPTGSLRAKLLLIR